MRASVRRALACAAPTGAVANPASSHLLLLLAPQPDDTERAGAALGALCRAGDTVLLRGRLGAGKTAFARGFVRGATRDSLLDVTSPTFLYCNAYDGGGAATGCCVQHLDLYRMPGGGGGGSSRSALSATAAMLGIPAIWRRDICIVEWPQRLQGVLDSGGAPLLPAAHLDVTLLVDDADDADAAADFDAAVRPALAAGALHCLHAAAAAAAASNWLPPLRRQQRLAIRNDAAAPGAADVIADDTSARALVMRAAGARARAQLAQLALAWPLRVRTATATSG